MNKRPKKRKYKTRDLDKYPFYPWIEKKRMSEIFMIISFSAFVFFILFVFLGLVIFGGSLPEIYTLFGIIGVIVISSFIGYATILKRESPDPSPVKGKAAVVYGWVFLGFCAIGIVVMIVAFLIELFSNS